MATLESITELGNLCQCALKCTKDSRWKESTQRYLADMLERNVELQERVLSGTYRVSPTINFWLNERGKMRYIKSPVVPDRIIQKSLMEQVLTPKIVPTLIYDNYASLKNRGTSFARKRFEVMLHRYIRKYGTDGYLLLGDISKYFDSVVHQILKQMLAPYLKDEPQEVIDLICYMIDTSSDTDCGLNLGSECPQLFAVMYLNRLDTFIKVVKSVKYYGRYMDDFALIDKSKQQLSSLLAEIETCLDGLGLKLNRKKTRIIKMTRSFVFLQVKYTITRSGHIITRPAHSKLVRERRRLKAYRRLVDKGMMTEQAVQESYLSWRGSLIHDHNCWHKSVESMDATYKDLFPHFIPSVKLKRSRLIREVNHEAETIDLRYCEEAIAQTSISIYS